MTTLSPTVTGAASEASKCSPSLLVFELTVWSTVTEIDFPAGTIIGLGAKSGAGGRCSADCAEFPAEFPVEESAGPFAGGVEDVDGD
jgi:hypothetical protein